MKFVKGALLFFVYPALMLGIGFYAGIESVEFFYPGQVKQENTVPEQVLPDPVPQIETITDTYERAEGKETAQEEQRESLQEVSSSKETLSVDTEYVLEETDILNDTVVETSWRLPDKYVGMNREQFLAAMESYEAFPPLSEMERGFVGLEVLSFSRERVVIQMNYQYLQPSTCFYLAVLNNEVVVYLEDMETIYINTGIQLETLPEDLQMDIIQMLWIEDEESLYNFLETYSS